jgi:hypothetical protein
MSALHASLIPPPPSPREVRWASGRRSDRCSRESGADRHNPRRSSIRATRHVARDPARAAPRPLPRRRLRAQTSPQLPPIEPMPPTAWFATRSRTEHLRTDSSSHPFDSAAPACRVHHHRSCWTGSAPAMLAWSTARATCTPGLELLKEQVACQAVFWSESAIVTDRSNQSCRLIGAARMTRIGRGWHRGVYVRRTLRSHRTADRVTRIEQARSRSSRRTDEATTRAG